MITKRVVPILCRVVVLSLLLVAGSLAWPGGRDQVAADINRQINFQGKVVNTDGTNIANGTYNMEFKIYSGGNGVLGGGDETLVWTESRLRNNSQGVTITDGIFQVNLGSITTLPGSVNFNTDTLWLSINLGNTNASCTPFSSCSPDGEMSPFARFTAAPYSLNSDLLDGIDSSAFGQLANSQTWTGANVLQPTTNVTAAVVRQTSAGSPTADIFNVQTANNTNVIQVTGPAANEAAVTIQSIGATRGLTLQSGSGTVSLGTSTALSASGALTVSSGGSSALTLDSASGAVVVADNLTVQGTGTSSFAGDVDIEDHVAIGNTAAFSAYSPLRVSHTFGSSYDCAAVGACYGTEILAIANDPTGADIGVVGLRAQVATAAASFTLDRAAAMTVANPIIGSGSSITTSYGLFVENMTAGATNNYGLYVEGASTYALWVDSGLTRLDGDVEVRGGEVNLGTSSEQGLIVLQDGSSNHGILRTTDLSGNHLYTLPNASGEICISTGNCAGGSSRLDQITAATTNASINNGANNIVWNWQLTGAETGMLFSENVASTGGGAQNQFILGASTLSGSTASPLRVVSNSVDAADIVFNLASAGDFEIQDNGTAALTVNDSGNTILGGTLRVIQNGFTPGGIGDPIIGINGAISKTAGSQSVFVVNFDPTITINTNDPGVFSGDVLFRDNSIRVLNTTSTFTDSGGSISFLSGTRMQATGGGAVTVGSTAFGLNTGLSGLHTDMFLSTADSSTLNVLYAYGTRLTASSIGSGVTVNNRYGVKVENAAGAGTVDTQYGIRIDNLTKGSTADYGLYIDGADTAAIHVASGNIVTSNQGVEFTESDTNPACSSGDYKIYADTSETKLKKCVNGVMSDIEGESQQQTFTSNGTFNKPSDAVMIIVEAWGPGGGGGGGGSAAAGVAATGGGGGGGGAYVTKTFAASSVGSTETVTIPAGGAAGSGGTNAAGSDGSAPTADTTFGALLTAYRGGGGANGNNSATLAGGGGGGGSIGAGGSATGATGATGGNPGAAAAGAAAGGQGGGGGGTSTVGGLGIYGGGGGAPSRAGGTTGFTGGGSNYGAGGGGGGGSLAATHANTNGGLGGPSSVNGGAGGTGAGGAASGGASGSPAFGGSGGGGGASNATADANGGAGGTGGIPGGGGGGGGAATFGTSGTGGAGGAGARGEVRVTSLRGSGADLAEIYCTNDAGIEAGDTVALDSNLRAGVKKTEKAYDANTLGAVATNPGLVIGNMEEQCAKPVLVALAGRVPIKVSTENGPIKAGDLLTASPTPGVAMKATKAGQIIGQALAGFSGQGVGTTIVFVKTDHSHGSTAGLISESAGADFGKQMLAFLTNEKEPISKPTEMSEVFTDRVIAGLEITAPKVTADKVATNSLQAATGKDITLKLADDGKVVLANPANKTVASFDSKGNASIALDLDVSGGLHVGGPTKFAGNAVFQKLVTFVEKTIFKNDITFEGHLLTDGDTPTVAVEAANGNPDAAKVEGNDTVGQLSLKLGEAPKAGKTLTLAFKKPYAKPPRIFLTPANDAAAHLKHYVESTPTGFTITLSEPPPAGITFSFNYWVVQ